jgi:hypothetical protein
VLLGLCGLLVPQMDLAGEIHGTEPTSVCLAGSAAGHLTKETQLDVAMWCTTQAMTQAMTQEIGPAGVRQHRG